MADEDTDTPGAGEAQPDDERDDERTDDADGDGSGDDDSDGKGKDTELAKAIRRRDKALREVRDLRERLEKVEKKDQEPDPVAEANTRLVRAEARAQLAAAGITDKDDQRAVLRVLDLSSVTVDKDGEADADEIEERISDLRRVFGKANGERKRSPRVDTRDRGSKDGAGASTSNPDHARYRRILKG